MEAEGPSDCVSSQDALYVDVPIELWYSRKSLLLSSGLVTSRPSDDRLEDPGSGDERS